MSNTIPRGRYYIYKVYDSVYGTYLGNLPAVSSDYAASQDINTGGSQITVDCAVSGDTSLLSATPYTDESGNIYTDESGSNDYFTEGVVAFVGIGTGNTIIRDGNTVRVWEYDYWYPNGRRVFSGVIDRHTDNFGGDTGDNNTELTIYSDGSDMDDHVVKLGSPILTLDVDGSFTPPGGWTGYSGWSNIELDSGDFYNLDNYGATNDWVFAGSTFTTGPSTVNVGAITLAMGAYRLSGYPPGPYTANIIMRVYTDPSRSTLLGETSQEVTVTSLASGGGSNPTPIFPQFIFPVPVAVNPNSQYFFTVETSTRDVILYVATVQGGTVLNPGKGIFYIDQAVNGLGDTYVVENYVAGTPYWPYDALWFQTFSTSGSTLPTFTSVDPSTGMLAGIISEYNAEGGKIRIGNIEATGLSLTYQFNTNTVYEGLQQSLTVAPNGFYYYVDLGTDLLYFQKASTTADIVLTKGVHLNKVSIISTTEYVVNYVLVVGGQVSGTNIYTYDYDYESIKRYGLKLQIHTDSNILDNATAHAVGQSIIDANKEEQYQTTVTVLKDTMDTSVLTPGKIIGFNGFGNYVDLLLAEIVHIDITPEQVTLQLGILPKRTTVSVEQTVRGLVALSSVNNPSAPS